MNPQQFTRISKFLSLVLRHQPGKIGIELDAAGWVDVEQLLDAMNRAGEHLDRDRLEVVVADNEKQRFAFSDDGLRIRANQGHSVPIRLEYDPATPPEELLHGTPEKFVSAIRASGLKKMSRHHVHLHADYDVAAAVGRRRGTAVVLTVLSGEMHHAGYSFWVTPNNVWLVDAVPPEFIRFPK